METLQTNKMRDIQIFILALILTSFVCGLINISTEQQKTEFGSKNALFPIETIYSNYFGYEEYCKNMKKSKVKNNSRKLEIINMDFHPTENSNKKPYEDFRMITDTSSSAYKYIQRNDVKLDDRGFLMQNNEWYCIALGSYWGKIGDKFIIKLSNGKKIKGVLTDMKDDAHTDNYNYAHLDGHIVEFLINPNTQFMNDIQITYHGLLNIAYPDIFDGEVIDINKIR